MTTHKRTPGPWVMATTTQGYEICTIYGVERQPTEDGLGKTWLYIGPEKMLRDGKWHWPDGAEQTANARLIAAAPDLLAALEMALIWLDYEGNYDVQGIRAAIAKATGAA